MKLFISIVGLLAVALTTLYLTTVLVYEEGSLGSAYLTLKPVPSFDHIVGGGEEGAWARANPGQPKPWWQSDDAVELAWAGDWEDEKPWRFFYHVGFLLTPLLWLAILFAIVRGQIRRWFPRGGLS
jgi:hypothetical protein